MEIRLAWWLDCVLPHELNNKTTDFSRARYIYIYIYILHVCVSVCTTYVHRYNLYDVLYMNEHVYYIIIDSETLSQVASYLLHFEIRLSSEFRISSTKQLLLS